MASGGDPRAEEVRGPCLAGRIKGLILGLSLPHAGERVLDVGCGSAENLSHFLRRGCDVTGLAASPRLLDLAGQRVGHRGEFLHGQPEELPFSDNEFDIVTLIATLEFTLDPVRAVAEAIRVCRGRVLIGALNRLSVLGLQGRLPQLFAPPPGKLNRYFHLFSLATLIRRQLPGVRLQWGSVLFLPWGCYASVPTLEGWLPVRHNPCGAFFALSFPVTFSLLTLQEVIRNPALLAAEGGGPLPRVAGGSVSHGS